MPVMTTATAAADTANLAASVGMGTNSPDNQIGAEFQHIRRCEYDRQMDARFPIRFDAWFRVMASTLFMPPSKSYLEIGDAMIDVRMAWAFRAAFPRSAVAATSMLKVKTVSRGVHGWAGRWLVNGSGAGIVVLVLAPALRAWVAGLPVRLSQLLVSVEDPEGLRALLTRPVSA